MICSWYITYKCIWKGLHSHSSEQNEMYWQNLLQFCMELCIPKEVKPDYPSCFTIAYMTVTGCNSFNCREKNRSIKVWNDMEAHKHVTISLNVTKCLTHITCICTMGQHCQRTALNSRLQLQWVQNNFQKNKRPPKANQKLYHSSSLKSVESNASSLIVPAALHAFSSRFLCVCVHI